MVLILGQVRGGHAIAPPTIPSSKIHRKNLSILSVIYFKIKQPREWDVYVYSFWSISYRWLVTVFNLVVVFFASLAASKDVAQSVLLGILSGPQPLLGSPVAFMLFFLSLLCWLLFFSLTFRCLRDLRITPHLLLSFLILLSHCFKYHLDTGDSHIYLPRQNLSSELKTLLLAHLTALISHQLLKTNMIGPSKPLALIFFPISVNGNSFLEVLASAITTTIIT